MHWAAEYSLVGGFGPVVDEEAFESALQGSFQYPGHRYEVVAPVLGLTSFSLYLDVVVAWALVLYMVYPGHIRMPD